MIAPGPTAPAGPTPPSIGARRAAPVPDPGPTLRDARIVLDNPGALVSAGWACVVVVLARLALEDAVTAFWMHTAPGTELASGKARLVALRFYVDDPTVARQAHQTWAALSDAAHHRGYELAPTVAELRAWVDSVAEVVEALSPAAATPTAGRPPTSTRTNDAQ